jgi:hypothetical protein
MAINRKSNLAKKSTAKSKTSQEKINKKYTDLSLPQIEVFAKTKGAELERYPGIIEFVKAYPRQRCLLLKNDHKGEVRTIAEAVLSVLSAKTSFEKIIHIEGCTKKDYDELLREVLGHKLDTSTLVLHNISKENKKFLCKMTDWFVNCIPPFAVVVLAPGEKETFAPDGLLRLFKVVDLSRPLKVQDEKEKMDDGTAPFKERQSTDGEFFLNGNMWTISYEGKSINLVDSKGLKYIHYLLSNPKKEIDALMLQREINKIQPSKYKNRNEGSLIEEGLEISRIANTKTRTAGIKKRDELGYSIKHSEMQAKDEIKIISDKREKLLKEVKDLEDIKEIKEGEGHLDETIVEKIASVEEEIFRLTKILASYGKGEIADIEKARSAVKNTINNSLKKINELHPSLWEHLDSRIQRRSFCSYTPAKHISWVLSP